MEYRFKPEPRVAYLTVYEREGNPYGGAYRSEVEGECNCGAGGEVRKFVEVLP